MGRDKLLVRFPKAFTKTPSYFVPPPTPAFLRTESVSRAHTDREFVRVSKFRHRGQQPLTSNNYNQRSSTHQPSFRRNNLRLRGLTRRPHLLSRSATPLHLATPARPIHPQFRGHNRDEPTLTIAAHPEPSYTLFQQTVAFSSSHATSSRSRQFKLRCQLSSHHPPGTNTALARQSGQRSIGITINSAVTTSTQGGRCDRISK